MDKNSMEALIGSIGLVGCIAALIAIFWWKKQWDEADKKAEEQRLRLRTEMLDRVAEAMKGKTFCVVVRTKHRAQTATESDLIQRFADLGLHADVLAQALSARVATGEDSPITDLAFIGTYWESMDSGKPYLFHLDLRVVDAKQGKHLAAGSIETESRHSLLERAMDITADAFGVRDAPANGQ